MRKKKEKQKIAAYKCVLCGEKFDYFVKSFERKIVRLAICRDCTRKAVDDFFVEQGSSIGLRLRTMFKIKKRGEIK